MQATLESPPTPTAAKRLSAANSFNKTDAGNGSYGICRVGKVLRSPSPDPRRSPQNPILSPFSSSRTMRTPETRFCAYAYVPHLTRDRVRSVLAVLANAHCSLTHLGCSDPPKKWAGTTEDALTAMTTFRPKHLSHETYLRDSKLKLHMTVALRNDERYGYDSVSGSTTDRVLLASIMDELHRRLDGYLTILGRSGMGKDQTWDCIGLREDCPTSLRNKITLADH